MNKLTLNESIAIPSLINSQSVAIEYIRNWFMSQWDIDFFKKVHINDRFMLHEFKESNFDKLKSLRMEKPSLAITPDAITEFNRDHIDTHQGGLDLQLIRGRLKNHFFKDPTRNMYLGISLQQLSFTVNFKVRVDSRAEQMDLLSYMNIAYRIGSSQGEYIDLDMHIPYDLILYVARDSGFEIENNRIKDTINFISYLNQYSILPIIYKYRENTGRCEYFIRLSELYSHISCMDQINPDDGEKINRISTNYSLNMNVELKFPAPKIFTYYSSNEHSHVVLSNSENPTFDVFKICLPDIPEYNDKKWDRLLITEWCRDSKDEKIIDFNNLDIFTENSKIRTIIIDSIKKNIPPSIFIEFKLYNNGNEILYDIDWNTLSINIISPIVDDVVNIGIYIDKNYLNNVIIANDKLNEYRYNISK